MVDIGFLFSCKDQKEANNIVQSPIRKLETRFCDQLIHKNMYEMINDYNRFNEKYIQPNDNPFPKSIAKPITLPAEWNTWDE